MAERITPTLIPKTTGHADQRGVLSPKAVEALAKAYSGRGVAAFGLYESTSSRLEPRRTSCDPCRWVELQAMMKLIRCAATLFAICDGWLLA